MGRPGGDRLVFSNGILALGLFAAILIVVFDAREQAMLPLYAIGVFICNQSLPNNETKDGRAQAKAHAYTAA